MDSGAIFAQLGSGAVTPDKSLSNLATKASEVATRASAVIKGLFSVKTSGSDQTGVVRATIAPNADIETTQPTDLTNLNRDPNRIIETFAQDAYTHSIGIPIIDTKELSARWQAKATLLQQALGDDKLSPGEQELLKTQQDIITEIKAEAINEGLTPEDIDTTINEITQEEFVVKNLKKLHQQYAGQEIPVAEVINVLQGKQPHKNAQGKTVFTKAPKSFTKNTITAKPSTNHNIKTEAGLEPVLIEDLFIGGAIKLGTLSKVAIIGAIKGAPKGLKPAITALRKMTGAKVRVEVVKDAPKIQKHHFLTNKHFKYYTGEFNKITSKYDLKLRGKWNEELMEHSGRHAKAYHDWALEKLKGIDGLAKGSKEKFLELFEKNIASKVRNNPEMLKKDFWLK